MPPIALKQLAALVDGRLDGDPDVAIHDAETLVAAREGDITFVAEERDLNRLAGSQAAAVVASKSVSIDALPSIHVADVHAAFSRIVEHLRPAWADGGLPASQKSWTEARNPSARIAPDAVIHPTACIAADVQIGARAVIHAGVSLGPGARLGEDVVVHPNVVVYGGSRIGDRCTLHAGAVIGAYGFGYDTVDGRHERGPQLGYVELGDDVEIGASTTIDRGTYGATRIGDGTKIDNLVMIAHNCQIGKANIICSQVGVAGSTVTGDYVVMGGQCGVRDHVRIGRRVMLGAQCGVSNDVPDDSVMLGSPATPIRDQRAQMISQMRLPEMRRQLRELMKQVAELERKLGGRQAA